MMIAEQTQPLVVRTDRGLSIAGTRITLYDVMDYVVAGWPFHLIQNRLNLTDAQISAVQAYLATHRAAVEQEYAAVLEEARQNREYWENRNRERMAQIAALPVSVEQEAVREKLRAWRARYELAI